MRTGRPLRLAAFLLVLCLSGAGLATFAGSSVASPIEEIYVLNTLVPNVDRYVPRTRTATLDLFDAGSSPNEIRVQGRTAYVTSSMTDGLIRADLNSGKVIDEIPLAPEQNPWSVALIGTRAYVSNWVTSSVSVVDLGLGSAVGTVPVGVAPEGLLLDGNRLFVAISGYRRATFDSGPGSVEVIDLATGTVVDTIPTPLNPQSLARDPAGRIHVLCTGNYGAVTGKVVVIDPATLEIESEIPLGGSPGSLAIDEHGIGYAGSYFEGVLVYDALNAAPLRDASNPVDVGGFGAGGVLAALGGGSWVAVSGSANVLLRIAPPERAYAIEETVAVGVGPISLARSFGHAPPPVATIEGAQG